MTDTLTAPAAPAVSAPAKDIRAIYDHYVETFATKDPARIVQNHAEGGSFWLHAGGPAVQGRDAIAKTFAGFFAQWPQFGFEVHRVLFTQTNWVLDWSVTAVLTGKDGAAHPIRFDAVDIIDVDADGLVARKDTFVDSAQLQAQLAKLG